MSKKNRRISAKRNQRRRQANLKKVDQPAREEIEPYLQRQWGRLIVYNFIAIFGVFILLVVSLINIDDIREPFLIYTIDAVSPVILTMFVIFILILWWYRQRLNQFHLERTNLNCKRSLSVGRIKLAASIILISIFVYPYVVASQLGVPIAIWIVGFFGDVYRISEPLMKTFVDWVVAGIGSWIGTIVLGACGNELWHRVRSRKVEGN